MPEWVIFVVVKLVVAGPSEALIDNEADDGDASSDIEDDVDDPLGEEVYALIWNYLVHYSECK